MLDKAIPELCSAKGFERKYDIILLVYNHIINIISWFTTGSSYSNACGKTSASFREHTCNSGATCGSCIYVQWPNDKGKNANALNTSSDS